MPQLKNKKVLHCLIIIAMTGTLYSQSMPESDVISTTAGEVEMSFIGHGSLMFKINDFVIHIDPVKSSGNYAGRPKGDLILVTHEHYDHLDPDLISNLRKPETIMFSNSNAAREVTWSQVMNPGDKKVVRNIIIEAVPAYNIVHKRSNGQPFHPKGIGIGYILTFGDKRFYIAGDTENTPEMKTLTGIDVAFLPMNLPYTMTPEMVADAAKALRPAILYPYHYGNTDTDEIKRLLKDTGIEVRIRKLQ